MTDKKVVDADGFLPSDYKAPEGNFMKFQDGENTFRVLSSAVTGYEYWTTENKPVRSKVMWDAVPADIRLEKDGKPTSIKHFWVFAVWNYSSGKVQTLEITQKGIMTAIKGYVRNEKWGNPTGYDFTVSKSGSGLETDYVTMANPHSDAPEATFDGNLEAIFEADGDMFAKTKAE